MCLCYALEIAGHKGDAQGCQCSAERTTQGFLERLPAVRSRLVADVQAAYDGDPAAVNLDEVILAYPGLLAITVYRLAHELHAMGVPLMPRIMTEWAHTQTGADIHPWCRDWPEFLPRPCNRRGHRRDGRAGRTREALPGRNPRGLVPHPRDEHGHLIRGTGRQRHPTVEHGVTIYANATVLGGETTIGAESLIGGSAFLTRSIPAGTKVAMKPPELQVKLRRDEPVPASDGPASPGSLGAQDTVSASLPRE